VKPRTTLPGDSVDQTIVFDHSTYLFERRGPAGLVPDRADVSAGTAAILVVLVALTNMIASRFARLGPEGTLTKKATR
jgi:hypothetical protein